MLRFFLFILSTLLLAVSASTQTDGQTPSSGASQPLILLLGPPMSGKTVFCGSISKDYGIPCISVEDLIRDNAAELNKLRAEGVSLAEMRYDPAMSRYMRERLKTADLSQRLCRMAVPICLPLAVSHNRAALSWPTVRTVFPSGLKAAEESRP